MVIGDQGKTGILYIQPWTVPFGAETSLYLLIKHLDREMFHPVVVLPDKGHLWERLQTLGVPVSISPIEPWFTTYDSVGGALCWLADLPERVERIVDAVHRWDIKIIHSNVADIFEGAIAAKLTGRPHILTVRSNRFAQPWGKSFISLASAYEVMDALSHRVVPVSNAVKNALSPFVAPMKIRVIHNGIEAPSLHTQPVHDPPDAALSQAENNRTPKISSIGRVVLAKGYDVLIDAAAMVVKAYPRARFSVFGPFSDKLLYKQLLRRADRLNLAANLHFEGHTDLVKDELHATDLLVVSSREEGFPRVVLEAMSAGKPVVSTRCGGPEDSIVDGETGYLVQPNNPRALADAILKVLKDPEHARQMGLKGQERVRQHFDARHITQQYEALYREVLDGEVERPTQDENRGAVLMRAAFETLEKFGPELFKMGRWHRNLERLKVKVKSTLSSKSSKNVP